MMKELPAQLQRILPHVRGPGQYVGGEIHGVVKPAAAVELRMALAFDPRNVEAKETAVVSARIPGVLDEIFVRHRASGPHPERPERLLAVHRALAEIGVEERARRLSTRAAREEELARVHTSEYLAQLERTVPGLENVHLTGQWVSPAGGLPRCVVLGRQTAQIICRQDEKKFKAA